MLFNSQEFIFLFLPLAILGFYLCGRYSKWAALAWLLGASLFFYGWWNPVYLALLLLSIGVNFTLGHHLIFGKSFRKPALIIGVIFNLSLLGYFKYANFFVDSLNTVFSLGWNLENIILPLAISFFTFQQIAYLVEAWRRSIVASNLLQYSVFVSFFPQLIAGPIVQHKEVMPQLMSSNFPIISWDKIAIGVTLFSIGLFKKAVIADSLSPIAAPVFAKAETHGQDAITVIEAWTGMTAYTFQLYFDFSGYSDMAIGLALLFGIVLPINFNSPYKAENIIDFWRRWHITLSRFLRDYLYIPLGGNRNGKNRNYFNLLLTMMLGGLWHGAGINFVIWGSLHGVFLICNNMHQKSSNLFHLLTRSKLFSISITFFLVAIAWVFFRAETFNGAIDFLSALNPFTTPIYPEYRLKYVFTAGDQKMWMTILILLFCIFAAFFLPNTADYFLRKNQKYNFKPNLLNLILLGVCWVCLIIKPGGGGEFLYFQF